MRYIGKYPAAKRLELVSFGDKPLGLGPKALQEHIFPDLKYHCILYAVCLSDVQQDIHFRETALPPSVPINLPDLVAYGRREIVPDFFYRKIGIIWIITWWMVSTKRAAGALLLWFKAYGK